MATAADNPMAKQLWCIAELAGRYNDPRWVAERAQTWVDLEQVIAHTGAEIGSMIRAMESAQDRLRSASAHVKAAQRERDRQRARASTLGTSLRKANQAAEAGLMRSATAEREAESLAEMLKELKAERTAALAEVVRLQDDLEELREALALVRTQRDNAQVALARRSAEAVAAETPVAEPVIGPAVADAETADPVVEPLTEPAVVEPVRVAAAEPTPEPADENPWAELVRPRATVPAWWKATTPVPVAEPVPAAEESDDVTAAAAEDTTRVIDLTDHVSYLSVRATMGQLLPHDLATLLMSGATVIRREGRLAAIIAVAIPVSEWSRGDGHDSGQRLANRLREQGFRVEFIDQAIAS